MSISQSTKPCPNCEHMNLRTALVCSNCQTNFSQQTQLEDTVVAVKMPLLSIFRQPAATIKHVLAERNRRYLFLLSLIPIAFGAIAFLVTDTLLEGAGIFLLGLLTMSGLLFVQSYILAKVGKMLGGDASYKDLIYVTAWGVLWPYAVLMTSVGLIATGFRFIFPTNTEASSFLLLLIIIPLALWIAYIQFKSIATAHKITTGMALVTWFISGLVFQALILGIGAILAILFGMIFGVDL